MKSTIAVLAVIVLLLVGAASGFSALMGGAASETNAENALRVQGFSQIHFLKRHIWFVEFQGCGKEDVARFDFSAVNPAKQHVNVSVCEGWPFKGATVRYP